MRKVSKSKHKEFNTGFESTRRASAKIFKVLSRGQSTAI